MCSTNDLRVYLRRWRLSDQNIPVRTNMPDGRSHASSVERLLVVVLFRRNPAQKRKLQNLDRKPFETLPLQRCAGAKIKTKSPKTKSFRNFSRAPNGQLGWRSQFTSGVAPQPQLGVTRNLACIFLDWDEVGAVVRSKIKLGDLLPKV